ncbi:hypothetical protein Cylst_6393 (plasmid) [Cylindrospermum stagnale PCC 7417]|uniref:DUF2188 domain-containing protein n=1 Tax=Cylindrospermum stagnale PCC 7417 TaxID=56107 RepID=K9X984_9NOST|nr:DUF2188 domain-containing protein [Cylindrospermum stagnale]AFZ28611.1 hypothetical protein Cylst_6393 [Cylindrospermum stagnale PCC 7417]
MPTENDRYVVNHPEGWAVKKAHAKRASGVFDTKAEAEAYAKEIVGNNGGGEVRSQDTHGKWSDSDTVKPGNDPKSSTDTKH